LLPKVARLLPSRAPPYPHEKIQVPPS
jgi:hypothetical protein